jgi:hypothetical protein
MPLPAWTRKTHPVVQRELAVWARYRLGFRLASAALAVTFGLSLLSDVMTLVAPQALGYLFMYIQSLPSGLAILVLKYLLLVTSAPSIARDRESHAWDAVRLTGLRPVELVAGRAAAIVRLLWVPILCWIALNVTLTSFFLFRRLFDSGSGDLAAVLRSLFFLVFDVLFPCLVVAFYLALGLLISTLAGTPSRAVAAAVALLGLLVVWGWVSDWLDQRLLLSFTLGTAASILLDLGWAAGLAIVLYKLAEWRVARGLGPIF